MVTKNTKKQTEKIATSRPAIIDALFAAVLAVAVFFIGLWAIDSGSLIVYVIVLFALYACFHYSKLFVSKILFFKNDKSAPARSAKK